MYSLFSQVKIMGVRVGSRLRNGNSHRRPARACGLYKTRTSGMPWPMEGTGWMRRALMPVTGWSRAAPRIYRLVPPHPRMTVETASYVVSGLCQRISSKRAKSLSLEHMTALLSAAIAASWASVVRLPAVPAVRR